MKDIYVAAAYSKNKLKEQKAIWFFIGIIASTVLDLIIYYSFIA